jgi:hypothetical protein
MKPHYSYDEETKTYSAYKFVGLLMCMNEKFGAEIDVVRSKSGMSAITIYDATKGKVFINRKQKLFEKLNETYDCNIDASGAKMRGYNYTFCICDEAGMVSMDDIELVVEETAEEEVEEAIEKTVDWTYAESLYDEDDKSGSKVKLELYARDFGVELSRRSSFDNMLKDFKENV